MGAVTQWTDRSLDQNIGFKVSTALGGVDVEVGQNQEGKFNRIALWQMNREEAVRLYKELGDALGHGPHPQAIRLSDRAAEEGRGVSF